MSPRRKVNGPADMTAAKYAAKTRDGWRCVECGMTNDQHIEDYGKGLEAHRIVPGSIYTVEGCVTLCMECHGPQPRRTPGQPDLGDPARNRFTSVYQRNDVLDLMQKLADEGNRPLSREIRAALIDWLTAAGKWPPKDLASDT